MATKTEDGKKFKASDYAYVPDAAKPSTWKLRLTDTPGGEPDAGIVGAAVAALGKGFRGQKVQIPKGDLAKVKAKVRAAWKKIHSDDEELPDVLAEAVDPKSLDGRTRKIRDGFRAAYPYEEEEPEWWIEDIYDDHVIATHEGQYHRLGYTVTDGVVTFDEPQMVEIQISYTPVGTEESTSEGTAETVREVVATGATILESLDDGKGDVWRVTMVRPGVSRNRRRYRPEVLAEAAQLYEGAKAFDGHRSLEERRSSGVSKMVGWHDNVAPGPGGALQSDFHIAESAPQLKALFLSAWKNRRPDLIGFSHDVQAITAPIVEGGVQVADVRKIIQVDSVDVVADPSAGGALERLVAGGQETRVERESDMPPTRDEVLEALKADPDLLKEAVGAAKAEEAKEPKKDDNAEQLSETVLPAGSFVQRAAIREALEATKLPEATRTELRDRLVKEPLTETQIAARVKETEDVWAAVQASVPAQLGGQGGRVETTDSLDKMQAALDGMLAGRAVKVGWDPATEAEGTGDKVAPFHSIHQAYGAFTGVRPYGWEDTEDHNRRILAGAVECFASPDDRMRLTESVTSASWANALRDSMTKRAIAEYRIPTRQAWRDVASEISPVNDFRTQRRFRIGGYDTLTSVGEGSAYPQLVSPTDEEATYAVAKRGGVDDLTMETIANDDVGAVRAIPVNMGRAAILTLFRAVFITTIEGNGLIYDGVALFDAAHANTDAGAALAQATYETGRRKMRSQARLGETSGALSFIPRILITPNELEGVGFRLVTSAVALTTNQNATEPNIAQGTRHLVVDELTDANDWFLVADPAEAPTFEVGFYQGRQDPEILVQDQPAVGSVFTADKITYKVRHIWGLTVLDYRSFYRGQG